LEDAATVDANIKQLLVVNNALQECQKNQHRLKAAGPEVAAKFARLYQYSQTLLPQILERRKANDQQWSAMKKGGKKVAKQRDANLKRDKKRTTQLDHREGKRFKEQMDAAQKVKETLDKLRVRRNMINMAIAPFERLQSTREMTTEELQAVNDPVKDVEEHVEMGYG